MRTTAIAVNSILFVSKMKRQNTNKARLQTARNVVAYLLTYSLTHSTELSPSFEAKHVFS